MRHRRFEISIVEASFVFAILSAAFAFVTPVVNQACYENGCPAIFDDFTPFAADNKWSVAQQLLFVPAFGIGIGMAVSILLLTIRVFLPQNLRHRIVWLPSSGPLSIATKRDWLRGLLVVAFLMTVLFLSIILFPR